MPTDLPCSKFSSQKFLDTYALTKAEGDKCKNVLIQYLKRLYEAIYLVAYKILPSSHSKLLVFFLYVQSVARRIICLETVNNKLLGDTVYHQQHADP